MVTALRSAFRCTTTVCLLPSFLSRRIDNICRLQDTTSKINARYYGSNSARAVTKGIHTQKNHSGRRPRLDLVMKERDIQPRIHDGIVTVEVDGFTHRFHIFVKNHRRLSVNSVIEGMDLPSWKGDIVIMRKGDRSEDEVVGLRAGDAQLVDFAIEK